MGRMRLMVFSVLFHGAVFGLALMGGKENAKRKATALAMADQEKKKAPEKKKPDKPPPPPPRPRAAPEPPAPSVAPPPDVPKPSAPKSPTPVMGELSNGSGGGGPRGDGPAAGPGNGGAGGGNGKGGGGAGQARAKAPEPRRADEEAPCTEAPTKPSPATRTREIEYTQDARSSGVEGRLVLKIIVAADGSVEDVIVVSKVDDGLDAAAIAAVKTWSFRPATRCGKPMAGGVYMLAQRFELGD